MAKKRTLKPGYTKRRQRGDAFMSLRERIMRQRKRAIAKLKEKENESDEKD